MATEDFILRCLIDSTGLGSLTRLSGINGEIGCGGAQCIEGAIPVLPFRYSLAHDLAG
jgi:hypothetical protein